MDKVGKKGRLAQFKGKRGKDTIVVWRENH